MKYYQLLMKKLLGQNVLHPMFIFQRNLRVELHKESACLQIHLVQIKLESAS